MINSLPVTVKMGLHAKTILSQYCHQNKLVYPTFSDALSNPDATGMYKEWRLFKARFELGGKKVVGSGLTKKDAEKAAARKFINNYFMTGENSPGRNSSFQPEEDCNSSAEIEREEEDGQVY